MGTKFAVRMLALFLVLGLAFGASQSAWAQGKSQLPQIKTPTSERFDISGKISVSSPSSTAGSNADITIGGSGAVSGNNMEANITFDVPAAMQGQGGMPSSFSLGVMLVDGKAYARVSGLAGAGVEDKWYVFEAPQGANAGSFGSGSIVPTDPALAQAYTITQVGKEDVNGAATTKYQIDVDINKLLSAIAAQAGKSGAPSATPMPSLGSADIKEQVFLWVGDSDQYLHKLSESVNAKEAGSTSSQTPQTTVTVDVTITFKDFDQPVTITAPPNAEPIDLSSTNGAMIQGVAGGFISNPLSAGLGSVVGVPSSPAGTPPPVVVGMPTTGSNSTNDLWLLAVLGAACVSVGAVIRRRATHAT